MMSSQPPRPGRIKLPTEPQMKRAQQRPSSQPVKFYSKIRADWFWNLAGLLAFNFLLSLFPLMLLYLAGAAFTLKIFPSTLSRLEGGIESWLPNGTGVAVYDAASTYSGYLKDSALPILVVGVASALIIGSRLFIAMENCFCVIYRTRPRPAIQRNILAIYMTVALAFGGQLLFWVAIIPSLMLTLLLPNGLDPDKHLTVQIVGAGVGFVVAFLLLGAMYYIIPNRRLRLQEVWKGAALAAAMLLVYIEVVFPLYSALILRPDNYGAQAGFVILLIGFLYYLAGIVLLGAEFNAWDSGIREPRGGFALYLRAQAARASAIRRKELSPDSPYFEE